MRIRPILIALVLMLALPAAASATSVYGSISGTVSLDGHGSANLCATAYDGDTAVGFANTDSGGDYQLTGLYPAQYTVKFDDCGPGYSTTQWFNHVSSRQSATPLDVTSGQDTAGINGTLTSTGRVLGHVTAAGGAPLHGVCVHSTNMSTGQLAETTTDVNGNYVLTGLVPGQTQIVFRGCTAGNYVVQYYSGATSAANATAVAVVGGQSKYGIDAVMTAAGHISGHVQNADGTPLQNFCVYGTANGNGIPGAVTDAGGNYTLGEVPPSGTYELTVSDCWNHSYLNLKKTGTLVAPPATTLVDFTMQPAAAITGLVSDADGQGIPSVCISARDQATGLVTPGWSRLDGDYDIVELAPGTYDVTFSSCSPGSYLIPVTTHGVVLPDFGTTDVNATLITGGKVSGHVVTAAGPLAGVCVRAGSVETHTDSAGGYTLGPIPAGSYTVTFTAKGCATGDWVSASASDVQVAAGQTANGVDATLKAVPVADASPASGPGGGGSDPTGAATEPSTPQSGPPPTAHPSSAAGCKVPKLVGLSLTKAKRALAKAGCRIGRVSRRRAATHRVIKQRTRRGASKPAGFRVAVTVGR